MRLCERDYNSVIFTGKAVLYKTDHTSNRRLCLVMQR